MDPEARGLAWTSPSPEATEALGVFLGENLPAGTVVALDGDLGAGKTTLTRGIGRGLGRYEVSSPTFTLHDLHEGGRLPLSHFDAWMEGREKALLDDGGDEWLGAEGVAVVEWADRVARWLPEPRLEVRLAHRGEEERSLELSVLGDVSEGLGAALVRVLEDLAGALPNLAEGPPAEAPGLGEGIPENP